MRTATAEPAETGKRRRTIKLTDRQSSRRSSACALSTAMACRTWTKGVRDYSYRR
jgi:hypothetical protein